MNFPQQNGTLSQNKVLLINSENLFHINHPIAAKDVIRSTLKNKTERVTSTQLLNSPWFGKFIAYISSLLLTIKQFLNEQKAHEIFNSQLGRTF